jgi:hypothetical protein
MEPVEQDVGTRTEAVWAMHKITKPRIRSALSKCVIKYLDAYIRTRDDLDPTAGEYAKFMTNLAIAEVECYMIKRSEKRMGIPSITSSHTVRTQEVMGNKPLDKGKLREV